MNRLTDEQMDKIIRAKFKNDNQISDKANSVFDSFKPSQFNNQFVNNSVKTNEITNNVQSEKHETNNKTNNMNNAGHKIIEVNFYKKLNRILSVAAVSLTVVIVGGTAIYFNKNGKIGLNNEPQIITYNQKSLVKNEKLEVSNEQILKETEKGFVKAYMLGKRDIGINLKSEYWNEFEGGFTSTDCYKVDNITENVSDIFIGEISGAGMPYLFLLMEDGTIQYVDLNCYANNVFYFEATKLEGLYNVVGLEQKSRKFSYSNTDYEYVNAIRNDGLRKEIEIGMVNNWYDQETVNYDKLNEKYIKAHNKEAIVDDGKGDFTVDNKNYYSINNENEYVYYMDKGNFYRVRKSNYNEECIATGVSSIVRNYADGRISVYVGDVYEIYSLDKNVVFKTRNEQVINSVTTQKQISKINLSDENLAYAVSELNNFSDGMKLTTDDYMRVAYNMINDKIVKIENDSDLKGTINVSEDEINNIIYSIFGVKLNKQGSYGDVLKYQNSQYILQKSDRGSSPVIKNISTDIAAGTKYITYDLYISDYTNTETYKGKFELAVSNSDGYVKSKKAIVLNGENGNRVVKRLSPSGWAGSSMQEIRLYENGDVYHVVYDGAGETEENVIRMELIAKNAEGIEEKLSEYAINGVEGNHVVEGIIIKGKNLNRIMQNNESWIIFENN